MVLEFYPVDYDDESVGFVAVEPEFEPWLIAAVGVTFEDISYSVLGEDESDGLVELIIDGEDFDNLQDLYSEYEMYGWSVIDDEDYEEWAEAFSAEEMSDEDYLLKIIEFDEKNPRPAKPYDVKSSLYEDGTVPSMAFFLDGKTVNPKVMLKAIREGRVTLKRNAEGSSHKFVNVNPTSLTDEEYLLEIIEYDEKNPYYHPWTNESARYEDGSSPRLGFYLDGKAVNPKVMLKAIREGRVTLKRNAENKRYYRGINLNRFAGKKSNRRNFAQTRREIKKDMFGSVSLGSVLTGVAVIGSILWLSNRK